MGNTLIIYQLGVPIIAEAFPIFIGTGSEGTPGACRRLVFPPGLSPLLAPISFASHLMPSHRATLSVVVSGTATRPRWSRIRK